jgi:hypothetical protein
MISAADPTFREQYPNGCMVYDRLGRQLHNVVACNLETGEVVRQGESRIVGAVLRMARGRERNWDLPAEFRRHGFWPAPLKIVPWPVAHISFEAEEEPAA